MKNFVKGFKAFVVLALIVLVAGMTVFGIFGFNNTDEYKQDSQLNVTISQDANNSVATTQTTVENFLSKNGIAFTKGKQVVDKGLTNIYFIDSDSEINVELLKANIETAIDNSLIEVEVNYNLSTKTYSKQVVGLVVALAISVVALFVYLFFVEKTASALTVVINAVISALITLSIIALARIPAYPFVAVAIAFAFVLSAILSSVVVNRFKEELKNTANDGKSKAEIANIGLTNGLFRIFFICALILVCAIILVAFNLNGFVNIGLQILVVVVVSLLTTLFVTPALWSSLKKVNTIKKYKDISNN